MDPSSLALRLVHSESGEAPDTAHFILGANIVLSKLQTSLVDLLGHGGVAALCGKALRLAQRAHPVLSNVTLAEESARSLHGLEEALLQDSSADPFPVIAAPIEHMISLLVVLLGEDIGLLPIRKIWPDIPLIAPSQSFTEPVE